MVMGHVEGIDRNLNPFRDLLGHYKKSAATRKLAFELTESQFFRLTKSNCFFCGSEPENPKKARKRKSLETPEAFKHNVVDRWYSHRGYAVDNCVPCCKTCNYAKRSMSGEDFIKWLLRATTHAQALGSVWQERKRAVAENLLQLL
jgi:hypothetical protein